MRKGFEWCRLSCLLHYIHYLSIPLLLISDRFNIHVSKLSLLFYYYREILKNVFGWYRISCLLHYTLYALSIYPTRHEQLIPTPQTLFEAYIVDSSWMPWGAYGKAGKDYNAYLRIVHGEARGGRIKCATWSREQVQLKGFPCTLGRRSIYIVVTKIYYYSITCLHISVFEMPEIDGFKDEEKCLVENEKYYKKTVS